MPYDKRRTGSVFIDVLAGNQSSDLVAFERQTVPQPWLDAEVVRLMHLRQSLGWDWPAIARDLGRTESGVKSKFKYILADRLIKLPSVPFMREPVPSEVLVEQARRIVAWGERSLTASLLGDPPPQFSALAGRALEIS